MENLISIGLTWTWCSGKSVVQNRITESTDWLTDDLLGCVLMICLCIVCSCFLYSITFGLGDLTNFDSWVQYFERQHFTNSRSPHFPGISIWNSLVYLCYSCMFCAKGKEPREGTRKSPRLQDNGIAEDNGNDADIDVNVAAPPIVKPKAKKEKKATVAATRRKGGVPQEAINIDNDGGDMDDEIVEAVGFDAPPSNLLKRLQDQAERLGFYKGLAQQQAARGKKKGKSKRRNHHSSSDSESDSSSSSSDSESDSTSDSDSGSSRDSSTSSDDTSSSDSDRRHSKKRSKHRHVNRKKVAKKYKKELVTKRAGLGLSNGVFGGMAVDLGKAHEPLAKQIADCEARISKESSKRRRKKEEKVLKALKGAQRATVRLSEKLAVGSAYGLEGIAKLEKPAVEHCLPAKLRKELKGLAGGKNTGVSVGHRPDFKQRYSSKRQPNGQMRSVAGQFGSMGGPTYGGQVPGTSFNIAAGGPVMGMQPGGAGHDGHRFGGNRGPGCWTCGALGHHSHGCPNKHLFPAKK